MEQGPIRAHEGLGWMSTPEAAAVDPSHVSANAPVSLEAAFGRQLDSWLSWYRIAMAASGLVLTGLVFSLWSWPLAAACYLVLSILVIPLLGVVRTEEHKRWVRVAILLVDICTVSVFVYIWGTRASPAVFLYVPIVVGWTLVPQAGLGRVALLLALGALAGLLLAEPDDGGLLAGVEAAERTLLVGPSGRLLFFGFVASSLIAVQALLNFTVARLRDHSVAVSRLLAERASHLREAEWARQLEEAERLEAVGRLAGGVAHDFNNLLTALIGCAEVAERNLAKNPEAARSPLRSIREAAERGTGLTAQLLDFASRRRTQPEEIDLRLRVTDTVQLLRRLIKDSVTIVVQVHDEPCGVNLDPSSLERLLLNLAVNAADAMPDGGTLTITVSIRFEEKGRVAVLEVQDQGTGISAEDLPHIFEPFFTRKARGKGTGLGLASVYGIVKQSHGEITVDSDCAGGTTFRITWPSIVLTAKKLAAREVPDDDARHGTARGTVLLVDDDEAVRQVASEHLRVAGYVVVSAGSGSDALRALADYRDEVDLLLTDVSMPGMSGFELAAEVRKAAPRLPLLFMSGYAEEVYRAADHALDAPLIPKPFSSETLVSEVRAAMERARSGS